MIDINRVMYQKWINEKVEVYSLGTVRSFHSTFSSILDHALLDMNLIEKNPVHRIRISKRDDTPDEDDGVLEFLEMDELNRLLAYLEQTPHGKYKRSIQYLALFTLIARTGLRVGEALALEWDDFDLDAGADVKYVADRLGHADTKITMNIYLHVSKKIEQDSMILYERHLKSKYKMQPPKENTT